jgi:hypothetical protein
VTGKDFPVVVKRILSVLGPYYLQAIVLVMGLKYSASTIGYSVNDDELAGVVQI